MTITIPAHAMRASIAVAATAGKSPAMDKKVAEAIRAQMARKTPLAEATETTPVPAPVTAYIPPAPTTGQVMFSDIVKHKVDYDFPVSVLENASLHPNMQGMVPTIDPYYLPDSAALFKILRAFEDNDTTLIHGPMGCGKSQLVKHACALTGRAYIRINMTEDAESSVIFGTLVAKDGSTVWEDGPATEAWLYGAVLNVDEYDVTPPGVAMGFQWMLENNGRLFLKEKPGAAVDKIIPPHLQSRLVMCGNTVGQGDSTGNFAGVSPQNSAFMDRFRTSIRMDYLLPKVEAGMIVGATALNARTADQMVQFAGLCRLAYKQQTLNLPVSPRTLLNWATKCTTHGMKGALHVAYTDKLTDSQLKIAMEAYVKVFGASA